MQKALLISGGWEGHEPIKCSEIVSKLLTQLGWQVQTTQTLETLLDTNIIQELSLIIPVWTMGEITPEQSSAIRNAVLLGVGLAGWHGGMCDSFRNDTEYQFMTGGQWVSHPGGIIKYTVNIKQDSEGFMAGINDFQIESEQYYMHTDPGNEVLATTTFNGNNVNMPWISGTVMPVVWKRLYGKGRVFYTSLGHNSKDFQTPQLTEIVKRGLIWAAKKE